NRGTAQHDEDEGSPGRRSKGAAAPRPVRRQGRRRRARLARRHAVLQRKGPRNVGRGTLEVTDAAVVIDVKLPLLAKPFESRIRQTVERELEALFKTA